MNRRQHSYSFGLAFFALSLLVAPPVLASHRSGLGNPTFPERPARR